MQKYYHKFLGTLSSFYEMLQFKINFIHKNKIPITIVLHIIIDGIIYVELKILDKNKYIFSFSSPLMILSDYLYHNNSFGLNEIMLYLFK